MAASLNKVILIGNVGKDPEVRVTADGKEIATFSLATTDSWKDKSSGERREKTEWHRIIIFHDALVHLVKNYVRKGSKLYVEGALQTRKWQDSNGLERFSTEIILQGYNAAITLLDNKNNGSSQADGDKDGNFIPSSVIDDDIPF